MSLDTSTMENLVLFLLLGIALHLGDCYSGQVDVNHGDVNDIIANHPAIKQLISRVEFLTSRVDFLEEKDRLNSEEIVVLTVELGECREDIGSLQEKGAEVGEWKEGWNTPQNVTSNDDGERPTEKHTVPLNAERKWKLRSNKQDTNHQRIRQLPTEETVAFFTTMTSADQALGPNQNIIFDNVVTNTGNGYNPHQGVFVAPVSGTYTFFSTVLTDINNEVRAHFVVNGKDMAHIYARGSDGLNDSGSQMIVVALNQGDVVAVQSYYHAESIYGHSYTTFSGYLLSYSVSQVIG